MSDSGAREKLARDALQMAADAKEVNLFSPHHLTVHSRLIALSELLAHALLEAEKEIEIMREALEYIAHKDTYAPHPVNMVTVARDALAKCGEHDQG